MRTLSLAVIAILSASAANAGQDRFKTHWSESCTSGKTSFSLDFKSQSGDPTEDDMAVTLRWGSNRPAALAVKPALYVKADFTSDATNLCKSVGAFKLPSGRVLLLLPRDDRPSEDALVAVVLDGSSGSVNQVVGDVGSYSEDATIISEPTGYRLLLLRKSFLNRGGGGGEFSAPDWMVIREVNGHVSYEWETKRP